MGSKRLFFLGAVILIGSVMVFGCSPAERTPASNVIAIINGEEITIEDIKKTIEATEVGLKISAKMEENAENSGVKDEYFDRQIQQAQTEDQKRYYERMKRVYTNQYDKSENDVFNEIIREEILTQEASKQGYQVTIGEARESRKQMDDITRKLLEEGKTEELNKLMQIEEEAANLLGFKNRDEWFEASLIDTTKSMARSRLKESFIDSLMRIYPEIIGSQWVALRSNAWEEYTEYLLRNSRLKIYDDAFKVEYYERNWKLGNLDLKNQCDEGSHSE